MAPVMALMIIFCFAGLRRESGRCLRRTIWIPGFPSLLRHGVALVHRRAAAQPGLSARLLSWNIIWNGFATNRYMHHQPLWYYLPDHAAGADAVVRSLPCARCGMPLCQSIAEWRARFCQESLRRPLSMGRRVSRVSRTVDPVPHHRCFRSLSQSKLPGYILPSIPPLTILTGDYMQPYS